MKQFSPFGLSMSALLIVVGFGWAPLRTCLEVDSAEFFIKLVVPGNAGWVDTGVDVDEGRRFEFRGEGEISLQKGNPEAQCGPDGYDIRGIQQPLPGENLGCLIGKIVQVLSVRTDEKTGEETRDEFVNYFFIGREKIVLMPLTGRLFVGINEDVVKDNDGQFMVSISSPENDGGRLAALDTVSPSV